MEEEVEVVAVENRLFMFGKEFGTLLLLGCGEGEMNVVGFVDGTVVVTYDIARVVSMGFVVGVLLFVCGFGW